MINSAKCVFEITQELYFNWSKHKNLTSERDQEDYSHLYQIPPLSCLGASNGFMTATNERNWKRISKKKDKKSGLWNREYENREVRWEDWENTSLIAEVIDDGQTIRSITFRVS